MLNYDLPAVFSVLFLLIFSLAVISLFSLYCLFFLRFSLSLSLSFLSLSLSLSLSISLLSLFSLFFLSLFSLYCLSSFSTFPFNPLASLFFFAFLCLYFHSLSLSLSLSLPLFCFSFLSYAGNPCPPMLLFGFLLWGLCYLLLCKKTQARQKNCFLQEWSVFEWFTLGWSGIEKLKENPKKGGWGGQTPSHNIEENIETKTCFTKILLWFLCSLHFVQRSFFAFLLLLIDHFQKTLLAVFLHPFENHKMLTSEIAKGSS